MKFYEKHLVGLNVTLAVVCSYVALLDLYLFGKALGRGDTLAAVYRAGATCILAWLAYEAIRRVLNHRARER